MKPHTTGRWYRTQPEFSKSDDAYDCGICIAGPDLKPQVIAECFGRSDTFIRHDAVANADRIVMCVNLFNGIENPKDAAESFKLQERDRILAMIDLGMDRISKVVMSGKLSENLRREHVFATEQLFVLRKEIAGEQT